MREMKDSGIEWCDLIPQKWNVMPNKYIMVKKKKICKKHIDEDILSLTMNGVIVRNLDDGGKMPTTFDGYQYISSGNLLMCLFDYDVTPRCIGYVESDGITSPAYSQFVMINDNCPKYYYYYYLMVDNTKELLHLAKNLRHSFTEEQFGTIKAPVPPIREQKKIACFLDEKCGEIDSLTTDIQEQITTLEEYKKSLITEVVTKGLNPNIEMKDSGIEWIGEVPKHWLLMPFKYLLNERNQKNNPKISDERLSLSIGLGVTLYADKTTNLDRFKEDVSQYKITHKGDLVMNSMNMIVGAVGVSSYFGCVSPAYYTFYDNEIDNIYTRFCEYIFLTPSVKSLLFKMGKGIMAIDKGEGQINTCRLKVSKYDLGKFILPCPPSYEIRNILNYLDEKCDEIDETIKTKKEQLDVLAEYKKSLIYEYVTGKKEVK